jgi:phosphoglycerate dehydrogenase-like enzyme
MNNTPIQILVTRPITDAHVALLQAVSPRVRVTVQPCQSADDITRALTPDVDVLYAQRGGFEVAQATGLRWIQTESAGVDHLHNSPAWRSTITITSANGAHPQVAQYVIAGLLTHAHRFPFMQTMQQQGKWAGSDYRAQTSPLPLRGATMGIMGYGAIGREVARLAQALGMTVHAAMRDGAPRRYEGYNAPGTGDPDGVIPTAIVPMSRLGELVAASDVLVLALPLSSDTRGLLSAAMLAQMKPGAVLINVGRGAVIDQAALQLALESGALGGAVLDVTDPEPLPDGHPLWRAPNTIITPHVSGGSPHMLDNVMAIVAENLRRFTNDEPLLNIVRREAGY